MTARRSPAFPGFPRALETFLRDLEAHNEKAWFDAHRDDYEAHYKEPGLAFVEAMAGPLRKLDPTLRADARVNGSMMRIHRDVRFAKDKHPYKTGLMFRFRGGKNGAGSGYFVRIGVRELQMAAGRYGFDAKELARYRKAMDDPTQVRALRRAFDKVLAAGPYELRDPHYKRVPRGFPKDHPAEDLLRRNTIGVHLSVPMPKALFGKDCVPFVIDRFREMRPVHRWLSDFLGG